MTLADQQEFRDVIGRFASGVTIITTSVDGAPFGTTASAVSSLSLDPPMVLVCLNKTSSTQAAILKAGHFCVNILAEGREECSRRFATKAAKLMAKADRRASERDLQVATEDADVRRVRDPHGRDVGGARVDELDRVP